MVLRAVVTALLVLAPSLAGSAASAPRETADGWAYWVTERKTGEVVIGRLRLGEPPKDTPRAGVRGQFEALDVSSDGARIALVTQHRNQTSLHVISLDDGGARLLLRRKGAHVLSPQWSADDRRIAAGAYRQRGTRFPWRPDSHTLLIDLATGSTNSISVSRPRHAQKEDAVTTLALGWWPDGDSVLSERTVWANGDIRDSDWEGTDLIRLTLKGRSKSVLISGFVHEAELSPDGARLAFSEGGPCRLLIQPSDGGRRRVVPPTGPSTCVDIGYEDLDFAWTPNGKLLFVVNQTLWQHDPATRQSRRLFTPPRQFRGVNGYVLAVSPTEGQILFKALSPRYQEAWFLVEPDGSASRRVPVPQAPKETQLVEVRLD